MAASRVGSHARSDNGSLLRSSRNGGVRLALAGRMDRELVEEKGWVSPTGLRRGLGFLAAFAGPTGCPTRDVHRVGPCREARGGARPFAFISPSFLMAIRFERLPWIQDLFYGVGAAVIAIIEQSAYLRTPLSQSCAVLFN
jgi:chromate transporter